MNTFFGSICLWAQLIEVEKFDTPWGQSDPCASALSIPLLSLLSKSTKMLYVGITMKAHQWRRDRYNPCMIHHMSHCNDDSPLFLLLCLDSCRICSRNRTWGGFCETVVVNEMMILIRHLIDCARDKHAWQSWHFFGESALRHLRAALTWRHSSSITTVSKVYMAGKC